MTYCEKFIRGAEMADVANDRGKQWKCSELDEWVASGKSAME